MLNVTRGAIRGATSTQGRRFATILATLGFIASFGSSGTALAAVTEFVIGDVTTRSFAAIAISDEALSTTTVRIFADSAGTSEITGTLALDLESDGALLSEGLGLVRVTGLDPEACVYVQVEAIGSSIATEPAAPPFREVCTPTIATKSGAAGSVFANDVLVHPVAEPDGVTPAVRDLVTLSAPGAGRAPLVSTVEAGLAPGEAVFDLSNLFSLADGASLEVAEGAVIEIREYRGLTCPVAGEHSMLRYRRVPIHEETATVGTPITELESPAPCYVHDTVCDDTVDIRDVQRVLNAIDRIAGECDYNPDFDVDADAIVELQDAQSVLDELGLVAPFP